MTLIQMRDVSYKGSLCTWFRLWRDPLNKDRHPYYFLKALGNFHGKMLTHEMCDIERTLAQLVVMWSLRRRWNNPLKRFIPSFLNQGYFDKDLCLELGQFHRIDDLPNKMVDVRSEAHATADVSAIKSARKAGGRLSILHVFFPILFFLFIPLRLHCWVWGWQCFPHSKPCGWWIVLKGTWHNEIQHHSILFLNEFKRNSSPMLLVSPAMYTRDRVSYCSCTKLESTAFAIL